MSNIVTISGGKASEQAIADECIKWCIKKLLPRYRTLNIKAIIKPMEDHGCCYNLNDLSRDFNLTLKKGLSVYELISTICHEMVHVKQYARKELRWCNTHYNVMWKKSVHTNTAYDDQPWEKEAYKLEHRLAVEFFTNMTSSL